jgi:hypothetical protein
MNANAFVHSVAITQLAESRLDQLSATTKALKFLIPPINPGSLFTPFKQIGLDLEVTCK